MLTPKSYHWKKTTDINREYAVFELLADENPILDAGFSDVGIFDITFNAGITGSQIEWNRLRSLIEEGWKLAELDRR